RAPPLRARIRPLPPPPLFPYTTLFRSLSLSRENRALRSYAATPTGACARPGTSTRGTAGRESPSDLRTARPRRAPAWAPRTPSRSEEHTSELQSRFDLVCRLLLEKKKH